MFVDKEELRATLTRLFKFNRTSTIILRIIVASFGKSKKKKMKEKKLFVVHSSDIPCAFSYWLY